jgi:outer membrane protein assembly factor BamB
MSLRAALAILALAAAVQDWPAWRGPSGNGVSTETNLPLTWSRNEHIAWKLAMPSFSGSTPVVAGGRIFLNVAEDVHSREAVTLHLWCVDRDSGTLLWQRPLGGGNRQERKQNMSSPSPVTDGRRVWVMTGTGVLKAFDVAGTELWARDIQQDYGRFGQNYGYGSSPLLYRGSLYIEVLHGMHTSDPSYLLRIDADTGRTRWRVERRTPARSESHDAYTTPALLDRGASAEIVILGGDVITGHDPESGQELWRASGLNPDHDGNYRIVASPVVFGDLVIAPTRERPMLALRPIGRGDVTTSALLWSFGNGPDVPTPVADGSLVYVIRDNGIMYCLDAKTGREVYGRHRLRPGTYSASPVLADGRIYATNEDGVTTVVKAGAEFQVLAENDLDDYTLSSPAIAGGRIFIRTTKYLWAIGR